MYDLACLHESIASLPIADLLYFDSIGSTNTEGLRLLETGSVTGDVLLLAQEQTAGRGRFQRTWISTPQDSLTFSLVLTQLDMLPAQLLGLLPLLGAVAVVEALEQFGIPPGVSVRIKWPNDVLLNDGKACGILSEASWDSTRLRGVVVGIGINLGHGSVPPPESVRYPATSIEDCFGTRPTCENLLALVLTRFFAWLPKITEPCFVTLYQNHLAFIGESVNIFNEAGHQAMTGTVLGITSTGDLILKQENNSTILCSAGEITVRSA
ncbi:MAG: biotin--[acetyl-CoA-carboxylase] ligase [Anaerolineae bacterium]|nr:biotin--[acetyl-CoA-carboxylase] ligase [Anaerolineae bacterium]